ncbi:hypothetical protein PG984_016142 [Apiospora sp. TS-2023a]
MPFFKPSWAVLLVFWTAWTLGDFSLYKAYNADALWYELSRKESDWTPPDLTQLCSSACSDSLGAWESRVNSVCADETTIQSGVVVKARALPLTFTYNAGLVCTQDQAASTWCFLDSQTWQGSDYVRWDPDMCFSNGDDNSTVAPECADPGFDVGAVDDDMSAIKNLYSKDLYCSDCFLQIYRKRLLNPWLPKANFTDYLIEQFDDIQRDCSTSLPYTTSASTLYVGEATPTTTTGATPTGGPSTTATATATCQGQTIQPLANWLTCNDLSDTYNISTGDARVVTGDSTCFFNKPLCVPLPCELDTLERQHPGKLFWRCSRATSPGGTAPKPNATIIAPGGTGTPTYYEPAKPAHPTQSGTISECGAYYLVAPGDDCFTVTQRFSLAAGQLWEWNPYLDAACSNLWLDYDVCVAPVTPQRSSTDGTCPRGVTCEGTAFGDCCSPFGFCGSGAEYCGDGGGGPPQDGRRHVRSGSRRDGVRGDAVWQLLQHLRLLRVRVRLLRAGELPLGRLRSRCRRALDQRGVWARQRGQQDVHGDAVWGVLLGVRLLWRRG